MKSQSCCARVIVVLKRRKVNIEPIYIAASWCMNRAAATYCWAGLGCNEGKLDQTFMLLAELCSWLSEIFWYLSYIELWIYRENNHHVPSERGFLKHINYLRGLCLVGSQWLATDIRSEVNAVWNSNWRTWLQATRHNCCRSNNWPGTCRTGFSYFVISVCVVCLPLAR
jgi:hypothetical protein